MYGTHNTVVLWLSSKEMDKVTRVQIPDEVDCILHSSHKLGKGMNPIILPSAMGEIVGETGLFCLGLAARQRKEKFAFKPIKLHLKLTLCHILPMGKGW